MEDLKLQTGDIFFTYKPGSFISWLITVGTRAPGESKSKASHVGVMINSVACVEALSGGVQLHSFRKQYKDSGYKVAIYRPINIDAADRGMIYKFANAEVGKRYSFFSVGLHVMDGILWRVFPNLGNLPIFTQIKGSDNFSICSRTVARVFWKIGKTFGKKHPYQLSPDDMCDFCEIETGKYAVVMDWREM